MDKGAIGIDIGSKYTVVALVSKGGVDALTTDDGHCIPTVIGYGNNERLVGNSAYNYIKSNLNNTITQPIRYLGMRADSLNLAEENIYSSHKIVALENKQIAFEVCNKGEQIKVPPEQAVATFLKYVMRQVEKKGILSKDVVISCPNYWTQAERMALIDACKIAEVNCLRIINELTATCLGYGLFRIKEFTNVERNVAFVDFGYSKMSVVIAAFTTTGFKILGQSWNRNLGVRNLDLLLIKHCCNAFQMKYNVDPMTSAKARFKLFQGIEKTRSMLSANLDAIVNIECLIEDFDLSLLIKRDEFEQVIAPKIVDVTKVLNDALVEANIDKKNIHYVELVGDGTRIPAIINAIKCVYGLDPSRTMVSSEACARGCAIQSAMLNPMFRVRDFNIHETNPFPIEVLYNLPGDKGAVKSMLLFDKGCTFPVTKSLSFDQRKEHLNVQLRYKQPIEQVYQLGNFKIDAPHPKEQNFTLVCKIKLDGNMICNLVSSELIEDYVEEEKILKPKPKKEEKKDEKSKEDTKEEKKEEVTKDGEPMTDNKNEEANKSKPQETEAPKDGQPMETGEKKEKVKEDGKKAEDENMEVDEYEIKKVSKKRHTSIKYAFEMHGLSPRVLTELLEKEQQAAHADYVILQTKSKKNECESYIYDTRNKMQTVLSPYVEKPLGEELLKKLLSVEQWLYKEGKSVAKGEYEKKTEEMKKIGDPILTRYNQYISLNDKFILLDNVVNSAAAFSDKIKTAPNITDAEKKELNQLFGEAEQLKITTAQKLSNWNTKKSPPPTLPENVGKLIEKIQEKVNALANKPKEVPKKEETKKEDSKKEEKKEEPKKESKHIEDKKTQPINDQKEEPMKDS